MFKICVYSHIFNHYVDIFCPPLLNSKSKGCRKGQKERGGVRLIVRINAMERWIGFSNSIICDFISLMINRHNNNIINIDERYNQLMSFVVSGERMLCMRARVSERTFTHTHTLTHATTTIGI